MQNKITIIFIFLSIICTGCSNKESDSSPPSVFITIPLDSSSVSEITSILGQASDDDSVKYVELYIDSISTGDIDSIAPYVFLWNTTEFLDSSMHLIELYAEDQSGNGMKSDPIQVIINNSLSKPQPLEIKSISYSKTVMEILFNRSLEPDFGHYEILTSQSEEGQKNSLGIYTDINDTLIEVESFNPIDSVWYWLKISDIYGYSSTGPSYFVLDNSPEPVSLLPITFNNNSFDFSWSICNETDFEFYSIYESLDENMLFENKIYESNQRDVIAISYQSFEINRYYYYQIEVTDYWGLKSRSNIQKGTSWHLFDNQYGQGSYDYGRSILQIADGSYITAGNTSTLGNQNGDVLLLKIDESGTEQWIHNLNFSPSDRANMLLENSESGYIVLGNTISPIDESKDILVFKTNQSGHTEWFSRYGSSEDQEGHSILSLINGGYIICGQSIDENTGFNMLYLLKINLDGSQVWEQTFGGNGENYGFSIIESNDGSFLITGMTENSDDMSGDAWLLKVDLDGNKIWEQTYGGTGTDLSRSLVYTGDGYIMVGNTSSYGSGNNDIFVIKVNIEGTQEWSNTYGGSGTDIGRKIIKTSDGSFAIAGYTDSFGENSGFNVWLLKIDALGNLLWDKTFGADGNDRALSAQQTSDGGFVLTGFSNSIDSASDILIIKTDDKGNIR